MPETGTPSRRERMRALALEEIREHGYAQIAAGGAAALSLNGIAKAMGMSGPAMYRYFASRDELLGTLVVESYEDLAATLADTSERAHRRAPEGRLRAVVDAYRAWATAAPHRYRLVFGSTHGSGELDPERIIPASHRSMSVLLTALSQLGPGVPPAVGDATLRRELVAWDAARPGEAAVDPGLALLGLTLWTRIHGIVSLEIEGFFGQVGVDPARLYAVEVDGVIARLVRG